MKADRQYHYLYVRMSFPYIFEGVVKADRCTDTRSCTARDLVVKVGQGRDRNGAACGSQSGTTPPPLSGTKRGSQSGATPCAFTATIIRVIQAPYPSAVSEDVSGTAAYHRLLRWGLDRLPPPAYMGVDRLPPPAYTGSSPKPCLDGRRAAYHRLLGWGRAAYPRLFGWGWSLNLLKP